MKTPENSDKDQLMDLWQAFLDGNEEAYAKIYTCLFSDVYQFLCGYLSDKFWARDLTQDIFIKLYIERPKEVYNVRGYYMNTARMRALASVKDKDNKHKILKEFTRKLTHSVDLKYDGDCARVYEIMQKVLKKPEQLMITLSIAGWKPSQIGMQLCISPKDVSKKLYRIRNKLKRAFQKYLGPF